jgi:YfiH family protein
MLRKEREGIHWLEFELLSEFPRLKHAVLLRHGGHSEGPFGSLNFSESVGDSSHAVNANKKKVKETFHLSALFQPRQVHGHEVTQIDLTNIDLAIMCDGAITSCPSLSLMVTHADCQAAIFYDPINHAAAAIHAGWRGQVQNIYQNAVAKLKQCFGSKPADLHVCISPSLGPRSAEFINYQTEFPKIFWPFHIGSNHFDLWEISKWQLEKEGVLKHHIQIAEIDTLSNPDDYFSYRRKKISGRHGTFIELS